MHEISYFVAIDYFSCCNNDFFFSVALCWNFVALQLFYLLRDHFFFVVVLLNFVVACEVGLCLLWTPFFLLHLQFFFLFRVFSGGVASLGMTYLVYEDPTGRDEGPMKAPI